MKRLLSLVLALALSLMAVPALADEPSAAPDDNPRVGSGEGARTLDELLDVGDFEPGRVLARVTDEFAPVAAYSDGAPAWAAEPLYSFGAEQQPSPGARSRPASTSDQVLLIQSDVLTTEELLRSLADAPGVLCAEPDYVGRLDDPEPSAEGEAAAAAAADGPAASAAQASTDDPLLERQWHLSSASDVAGATNACELWARSGLPDAADLREVVVAVIDTGVDCTHPDLVDSLWVNDPEQTGLPGVHGYDFFHDADDPRDDDGHGTHVAGIVAATANNGEGGAGMAPNAKVMGLRIANEEGGLVTSLSIDAYSYMKQAVASGVPVVAANDSWGGPGVGWLLNDVMEDAYRSAGIVSFCSSGNSSVDNDLVPDLPSGGTSEGIVTVNAADRAGALASFSNYGAAATDIAAPGDGILSTVPAAQGAVDLDASALVPVRDDFEGEPGLFAFAAEGSDGATTAAVRTDAAWAGFAASGHSVRWTVRGAHEGQAASLVLRTEPGAVRSAADAAGASLDDLRYLAFNARVSDSEGKPNGRKLKVSLLATDGEWLDITPEGFAADNGAWKTSAAPIPDEARSQVDWDNFAVKLTRVLTAYDEGLDLEFGIDDVSLAESTAPYDSMSGTSMASPAAAGAYALLAGVFADEGAETLRARLLGGARRADALAGTCTSDGMVDVMRSATNPRPVVDALECAADGSCEATVQGSWLGSEAGRVLLDGEELAVTQWGEREVRVALPASLASERRYVEVVRADGETGRRQVLVGSEAEGGFFESLPAPDLESLGLVNNEQDYPWRVAAAGGRLYAANDRLCRSDGQGILPFNGLLVYDPARGSWRIEEALGEGLDSSFLLCAHGDVLYLLTVEGDTLLYALDTASGILGDPVDGSALGRAGFDGVDAITSSVFCDGRTLWLCGGATASDFDPSPLVARLDVRTGEAVALPPLGQARAAAALAVLDGVPTVAGGGLEWSGYNLVGSVERLVGGVWESASMPSSLTAAQNAVAAWGVLPAGSTVEGAKAAGERLVLAGLSDEGPEGADTWVYDPAADSWQALSARLAAGKVSYAGGAVLGDAFYVLGVDAIEGRDVFKRLTFEVAPAAGTTRAAVVQGTLAIGDDASYEASLQSSGYTARAAAQALSDADAEGAPAENALACGTPFVDPLSEGLLPASANALALHGEGVGRPKADYQVGDARAFAAYDRPGEEFEARVIATGDTYTIWEEEGYDLFAPGDLEAFAAELDAAIGKLHATFGDAARFDLDGDGKVAFVFHRFGESTGYAAGYFWGGDLFSREDLGQIAPELAGSTNEMDMLHLDTANKVDGTFDEGVVMGTLVHELQHLVTFAQTGGDYEAWLSEAFSQAAMAVAGYGAAESANLNYLRALLHYGVGASFVFEGSYTPRDSRHFEFAADYAQWYLFSRYLANQTKGLSNEDGTLCGGDGLYRSVFDCERNDRGFGSCTKDALVKTLEALGYLGEGARCAAEDFDELVLNYNTALLVRDKTGPYSLTNDPDADPSAIDGARIDLLSVSTENGFIPEAVYGGGAAVYVELDRAQSTAGAGRGVQERIVDSPLPLDYAIEATPVEGSALRDGEPVSLDSPYLAVLDGARLECCSLTEEELLGLEVFDYPFRAYDGPFAFDADKPHVAARIVCDRGRSTPAIFAYEVDAPKPVGPEEPEAPGKPDVPPPAEVGRPAAGDDVPVATALAPTGDPLALASATLAALAAAGFASALATRRRAKQGKDIVIDPSSFLRHR